MVLGLEVWEGAMTSGVAVDQMTRGGAMVGDEMMVDSGTAADDGGSVSGERIDEAEQKAKAKKRQRELVGGATVYVDGCSRGNPGPAGAGYYIVDAEGRELKRGGAYLGFATSRVAEYYAMKEGVRQAQELGLKSVRFVGDNLMMINQLNGVYAVKNLDLVPIYNDIRRLVGGFEAVSFMQVSRGQNVQADAEANRAVDRHFEIRKRRDIM